jgi:hypothetical protein
MDFNAPQKSNPNWTSKANRPYTTFKLFATYECVIPSVHIYRTGLSKRCKSLPLNFSGSFVIVSCCEFAIALSFFIGSLYLIKKFTFFFFLFSFFFFHFITSVAM